MRFLTALECADRAQRGGLGPGKAGRQYAKRMRHFVQLGYQSPMQPVHAVATILVECLGSFGTALLWAYQLPFGDRSQEQQPPSDWQAYGRWRSRQDERRSLFDAPGHEFDRESANKLAEATAHAILLGWDAKLFSMPLHCLIDLSHDDIITLRAPASLTNVSDRLVKLGLRRIVTANPRGL